MRQSTRRISIEFTVRNCITQPIKIELARLSKSMCNIHKSWLCHLRLGVQWHGRVTVTDIEHQCTVGYNSWAEIVPHFLVFSFLKLMWELKHSLGPTLPHVITQNCLLQIWPWRKTTAADEVWLFLACKWGKKIKILEWMNTFYFLHGQPLNAERCPEWCVLLQRMS